MADETKHIEDRVENAGEVFERLEGESEVCWNAFRLYRDFFNRHPTAQKRNIKTTMLETLSDEDAKDDRKVKNTYTEWRRWSTQNKWVDRVKVFDTHLDREQREIRNKAMRGLGNKLLIKLTDAINNLDTSSMKSTDINHLTTAYGNLLKYSGDVDPARIEIVNPEDERQIAAAAAEMTRQMFKIRERGLKAVEDSEAS